MIYVLGNSRFMSRPPTVQLRRSKRPPNKSVQGSSGLAEVRKGQRRSSRRSANVRRVKGSQKRSEGFKGGQRKSKEVT